MDCPLSQLIASEFIFERREERPRCRKQRIVFLESGKIQHRLSVQLVSGHAIPDSLDGLRNGFPDRGTHQFELRPYRRWLRGNVLFNRLCNAFLNTHDSIFCGPSLAPSRNPSPIIQLAFALQAKMRSEHLGLKSGILSLMKVRLNVG